MNKPINVLVVDDESLAREAITIRLQEFPEFNVCGEADNGSDAIVLAHASLPDVIFLDIEMPDVNGLIAAKAITQNTDALIVFVTAYDHYALQAFRVNAIDYLLKPIDDALFKDTLNKLKQRVKEKNSRPDIRFLNLLNELKPDSINSKLKIQSKYLQFLFLFP